ncbi:MAG: glutamate 5-kinase [Thiomargarita sp.]|nr:glutamate 5-kinase [Thiomargarita sp.]
MNNLNNHRTKIKQFKRWVIKIGSALLTNDGQGLDKTAIKNWVTQIATLCQQHNIEVVMVSSGAIAEGMTRLNWKQRPTALHQLQAAAAVGQMGMVQVYESFFQQHGMQTAQILLTHDDLTNRQRYLNARSTLRTLINLGVIPIINENDTVTTEEIHFGDNDTLGSLVANLIEADLLVILTDQQGLYESDPRVNPEANLIQAGYAGDPNFFTMASSTGGKLGRGGMLTKLNAAKLAARSGTTTLIAPGYVPNVLTEIFTGKNIGTLLLPKQAQLVARKQWLASHLKTKGQLYLDNGAVEALLYNGKSLLAIGVTQIIGTFKRGEVVACFDSQQQEIARGLINYSAEETQKILGYASNQIEQILGYIDEQELIHRDNLVLL